MQRINMNIPEEVQEIMRFIEANGFEAYIVGGACRDAVMGIAPHDFDMATSATPEEIVAMFAGSSWGCIGTGEEHGTYTVGGHEVTAFRADYDYDGRRPQRTEYGVSREEDAGRRDITINCIYIDICGNVYDPFNGISDIQDGVIRAVGNADHRFWEDHHRMMRVIRFASSYGFSIHHETMQAIFDNNGSITEISGERIWSEFVRIIMECEHIAQYETYINVVMGHIIPNIHRVDWQRVVDAPESIIARVGMIMAYAGVADENVRPVMRRMACSRSEISSVEAIVRWHNEDFNCRADVRRAVFQVQDEFAHVGHAIQGMDRNNMPTMWYSSIVQDGDCVSVRQMNVSSADVMAEGYEGQDIGRVQRGICHAIMADVIPNQRDAIIEWMREN